MAGGDIQCTPLVSLLIGYCRAKVDCEWSHVLWSLTSILRCMCCLVDSNSLAMDCVNSCCIAFSFQCLMCIIRFTSNILLGRYKLEKTYTICIFKCWTKCYMSCWRAKNKRYTHNAKTWTHLYLWKKEVLRACSVHSLFFSILFYHYFIKLKVGCIQPLAMDKWPSNCWLHTRKLNKNNIDSVRNVWETGCYTLQPCESRASICQFYIFIHFTA